MADPTGRKGKIETFEQVMRRLHIKRGTIQWIYAESIFQAGRDSMKTESVQAIEAEADRLKKLDKGPSVLIREFAARFRDSK